MPKKTPIFYSALMLTAVNLLLRFVSTSFQVFLSQQIGAEGIGLLQLVLSVGALSMTAGMGGIRTTTMYLTAEEIGKKRKYNVRWVLSGCFVYSILCSGLIAIGLYFFAPLLAEHWIGNIHTVSAIRLYSSFIPVCCLCGVMTGYFTAANRIGTLAIVEIGEQLLSMAVTMSILLFWARGNAERACQSVIFGSGISAVFTLIVLVALRIREQEKAGRRIAVGRRIVNAALPLGLADNLRSGISTTENLMVPKRLALYTGVQSPLAAFGVVCGMVFPILMFPAAILFGLAELLIPEMARCAAAGSHIRVRYLATRSLRVCIIYGFIFFAVEYLLAEELCFRLYKNIDAGKHLRLYALLIPMLYCDAIVDAMIKGLGQQKICVRYNIITSGLDVIFLYLLLPKYGMQGYFFSFFITHLINFILSLRRLIKIIGNVLPIAMPIKTACGAVAALWISSHISNSALQVCGFLITFSCLLVLMRVINKEDITWLTGLVNKK